MNMNFFRLRARLLPEASAAISLTMSKPSSSSSSLPSELRPFARPNGDLRLRYPCLTDACTLKGLANLRRELPESWPQAMEVAWRSLARATPDTTLDQVFERGSPRILPNEELTVKLASARRSALGRLRSAFPALRLHEVSPRRFDSLIRDYRKQRKDQSTAITIGDLTELRCIVDFALAEAGLRTIPRNRELRPRRRQGKAPERPVATMDEVDRLIHAADGPMQALILLRVVTTVPDSSLLGLRRGDLDLDNGRLRVDATATRRPGGPEGWCLFGLPPWCVDQLRHALPGLDSWEERRLLFPSKSSPRRPRRDVSKALRRLGNGCGCLFTTMRSLRRLAQSIHGKAPRAVRRGTATARHDCPHTVDTPDDARLADAQEAYATLIVKRWDALHRPPFALARVARRAAAGIRADQPERGRRTNDPARLGRPVGVLPGCEVDAPRGRPAPRPRPSEPTTGAGAAFPMIDPWTGKIAPPGFWGEPDGQTAELSMALVQQSSDLRELIQRRLRQTERRIAELERENLELKEVSGMIVLTAVLSFTAGMAVATWLESQPDFRKRLGPAAVRAAEFLSSGLREYEAANGPGSLAPTR